MVQVCQVGTQLRQAIQQRIQRIDHLEPRQMLTNTDVRTVAEGAWLRVVRPMWKHPGPETPSRPCWQMQASPSCGPGLMSLRQVPPSRSGYVRCRAPGQFQRQPFLDGLGTASISFDGVKLIGCCSSPASTLESH